MDRPIHGGNLRWAAAVARCSPDQLLDFSASINPLGPPASAIAAIQAALGSLRHYPDPDYQHLRQLLAAQHGVDPDWILPGNGSAELLTWAAQDLAQLTATCVITPGFGDYFRALQAVGAPLIRCPLDLTDDRHPDSLPGNPAYGLLLNNPHNPTGRLWTQAFLEPYLEQFALVVVDEAFMDFLPPSQQQSLIDCVAAYPNLVILRSLTKFYSLPGLRIGYAISHPDRLRSWQNRRDPWPVNSLAVAAAAAVLQDTDFQQQTWAWLSESGPLLYQQLTEMPGLFPYPSVANYLLVRSAVAVLPLQQTLLQSDRILIRDCLSFPELGDHYFRIAIRTLPDHQRLLTALSSALTRLMHGG